MKNKSIVLCNPAFVYIVKKYEIRNLKGHLYSHAHCSIIHNSQDLETTKCTLIDEWIKEIGYIYKMDFIQQYKRREP